MIKIVKSALIVLAVLSLSIGATGAYFADSVTSSSNVMLAGTLDLNLDGGNANVVKFDISGAKPNEFFKRTYRIDNTGNLDGYLDLNNIAVRNYENGCLQPEIDAGDTTCGDPGLGLGDLGTIVRIGLYTDVNANQQVDAEDRLFFNLGTFNELPTSIDLNELIPAGGTQYITMVVTWIPDRTDSQMMSDSLELDMNFVLTQSP